MIEELEVFFIKEVVTQGFILQKQDEQSDYLYFVFKGRCRMFANTANSIPSELINPDGATQSRKHIIIGYLKRGDSFGEESSLNDCPNPYSVEALTQEVHLYKILRGHLIQYFGGVTGDPVTQLRVQIVLKTNWLRGKLDFIRDFLINADQQGNLTDTLSQIEFRNDDEAAKLRPTKTNPKEVPFIKNNPREKEIA